MEMEMKMEILKKILAVILLIVLTTGFLAGLTELILNDWMAGVLFVAMLLACIAVIFIIGCIKMLLEYIFKN